MPEEPGRASNDPTGDILIVGGGIAGSALALALARRGIACRLIERAATPPREGAGIQIGPNGTRILRDLGLAADLAPRVAAPDAIAVRSGVTGRTLARLPLGDWLAARHGAPYWTAHRADLLDALWSAVERAPQIVRETGFEVQSAAQDEVGVSVAATDGRRIAGRILLGADGQRSVVRNAITTMVPSSGDTLALRAVLLNGQAAGLLSENVTGLWLSPGSHVVHYPVRGGSEVAIVLIVPAARLATDLRQPLPAGAVAPLLAPLCRDLRAALEPVAEWRAWTLADVPPLPRWTAGRIALLGDAAHPVLPYLAQGAVLALEDAVVLADLLAEAERDPHRALPRYEALRQPRARAVQAAARRNGWIYHLGGPAALARDRTLQAVPGVWVMRGYDWLYGWQAGGG